MDGDLSVLGVEVDDLAPAERILFRRKNVGFLFQQYNLLPAFTAAENVAVPLLIAGISRKEALDRAGSLLSRLGLSHRIHALPRSSPAASSSASPSPGRSSTSHAWSSATSPPQPWIMPAAKRSCRCSRATPSIPIVRSSS